MSGGWESGLGEGVPKHGRETREERPKAGRHNRLDKWQREEVARSPPTSLALFSWTLPQGSPGPQCLWCVDLERLGPETPGASMPPPLRPVSWPPAPAFCLRPPLALSPASWASIISSRGGGCLPEYRQLVQDSERGLQPPAPGCDPSICRLLPTPGLEASSRPWARGKAMVGERWQSTAWVLRVCSS